MSIYLKTKKTFGQSMSEIFDVEYHEVDELPKQEITQDYLKELFDYRDGSLYWKKTRAFGKVKKHQKAGTLDVKSNCESINILYKMYLTHRLIYMYHHGYMPKMVDHIDGNRLNNRIENLRAANKVQNGYNSKKYKTNTSGFKGVSWCNTYNKWVSYCNVDGKRKNLGYSISIEDAIQKVKQFREKHHGEFVNHG